MIDEAKSRKISITEATPLDDPCLPKKLAQISVRLLTGDNLDAKDTEGFKPVKEDDLQESITACIRRQLATSSDAVEVNFKRGCFREPPTTRALFTKEDAFPKGFAIKWVSGELRSDEGMKFGPGNQGEYVQRAKFYIARTWGSFEGKSPQKQFLYPLPGDDWMCGRDRTYITSLAPARPISVATTLDEHGCVAHKCTWQTTKTGEAIEFARSGNLFLPVAIDPENRKIKDRLDLISGEAKEGIVFIYSVRDPNNRKSAKGCFHDPHDSWDTYRDNKHYWELKERKGG